ncbi:MAG: helix-turn-helix domain-containing protein [Bacteroidetes bacterium]|nr:helix-turn-helix domain-containing protein [Bacteroidota bacterium]MBS1930092.1 helix-turn-helix domain-containing protein [Bacteroidota bacterium]
METNEIQQELFIHLKKALPPHLSLVDELCDLLDLSADSVYRRIRGEKPISLAELKKVCEHFNFSIDQLLQLQNESVLFQAPGLNNDRIEFIDYIKGMLGQFKYFNSFEQKEIKYLCKDVPFWYFYLFPELASFKTFFWIKTITSDPGYSGKQFSFKDFPFDDCFIIGQQILKEFNKIPSVELWNKESINSTINQIAYYKEAGIFKGLEDMIMVVDSFQQMLDHLQQQSENGVKFMPGSTDVSHQAPIQFYVNELILGNNTILFDLNGQRVSMMTYSVLNYLITRDTRFADKAFNNFNTLLSRSTLVSKTGEKDRNRFFNRLREKLNNLKK